MDTKTILDLQGSDYCFEKKSKKMLDIFLISCYYAFTSDKGLDSENF